MRLSGPSERAGAALVVAILLAGCASPSPVPSSSAPPSAAAPSAAASAAASSGTSADAVTIQGFAFGPKSLTVPVGSTVTWTNQDPTQHTVTADDGSFGSQPLPTGQTFSQTFSKAGTFAYHCTIHPSMTATIVVQ